MIAFTREPSGRRASTIGERLVDPPAERRDDAVDHPEDVLLGEEVRVGHGELAVAFDVDAVEAVHHDLGDRRVGEVALDRSVAQHLVGDLGDELIALGVVERDLLLLEDEPELRATTSRRAATRGVDESKRPGPCARAALPGRGA